MQGKPHEKEMERTLWQEPGSPYLHKNANPPTPQPETARRAICFEFNRKKAAPGAGIRQQSMNLSLKDLADQRQGRHHVVELRERPGKRRKEPGTPANVGLKLKKTKVQNPGNPEGEKGQPPGGRRKEQQRTTQLCRDNQLEGVNGYPHKGPRTRSVNRERREIRPHRSSAPTR